MRRAASGKGAEGPRGKESGGAGMWDLSPAETGAESGLLSITAEAQIHVNSRTGHRKQAFTAENRVTFIEMKQFGSAGQCRDLNRLLTSQTIQHVDEYWRPTRWNITNELNGKDSEKRWMGLKVITMRADFTVTNTTKTLEVAKSSCCQTCNAIHVRESTTRKQLAQSTCSQI